MCVDPGRTKLELMKRIVQTFKEDVDVLELMFDISASMFEGERKATMDGIIYQAITTARDYQTKG